MKKIKLVDGTTMTLDELVVVDPRGTPYVMTLLRKKQLNPEDVPKKLLSLKNNFGTSVLDICIERFKENISIVQFWEIMGLYPIFVSRARYLVLNLEAKAQRKELVCLLLPYFRKIKEVLTISDRLNISVTHELVIVGLLPIKMMTPDILKLENTLGVSVLETLIISRQLTPEILSLPLDKETFVFTVLQTAFQKCMVKEDQQYIDIQLRKIKKLLVKEQINSKHNLRMYNLDLDR